VCVCVCVRCIEVAAVSHFEFRRIATLATDNPASLCCDVCADVQDREVTDGGSDDVAAAVYCENCRQNLCRRCAAVHKRLRVAADHKLVELGYQVASRQLNTARKNCRPTTCAKHNHSPLEIYCKGMN